jgi:transaldolase
VTSNPAIFERAIDHSSEYDGAIAALAYAGNSSEEILERLALDDVSAAAQEASGS